ncbi:MAG: site-specific integrase [Desulfovibrio sp.]|nr:site-specific integrase [Desulfovibrio sp.]
MRQQLLSRQACAAKSTRSAKALTFDAFVAHVYLPHIKVRKRSWHTDSRIILRHLSPVFGGRPMVSIRQQHIEEWLRGLLDDGFAPTSCNRFLAVLKTICSVAEARGCLAPGSSPCRGIPAFRTSPRLERYLSRSEAEYLMRALKKSPELHARALRLLLLTGARKSEILKARWENVDLDRRILVVPLSKSGKTRHITLSEAAVSIIRSLPKGESPWLFPGQAKDKPLSDLYVFWDRLRRELGLTGVRIHDLRHTFASFLVNTGHPLYEVQKMLGHADPRTTMRYAHLEQATLQAAAEAVSKIFAAV